MCSLLTAYLSYLHVSVDVFTCPELWFCPEMQAFLCMLDGQQMCDWQMLSEFCGFPVLYQQCLSIEVLGPYESVCLIFFYCLFLVLSPRKHHCQIQSGDISLFVCLFEFLYLGLCEY